MQLTLSRLAISTALITVCLWSRSWPSDPPSVPATHGVQISTQSATPSVVTATAETPQQEPAALFERRSILRPIDFPRLTDSQLASSIDSKLSPVAGTRGTRRGGVARLLIVFSMLFFWLRVLLLCNRMDREQSSKKWHLGLFSIGVVGIFLALLVPAYVPIIGILLVTNLLPFGIYKRIRNLSPDANPKLRWRELLVLPVDNEWHDTSIKFEPLFVGQTTASQVKIIEKATSAPNILWEDTGAVQRSRGYELARSLIRHAVESYATDLHVSTKNSHVVVQERIDGSIRSVADLPMELGKSVINVFKVMSDLNIANRRKSQDGSFSVDVNDRRLSFRVCAQGTEGGEKLSIRILDPATTFANFSSLGMPVTIQERFKADIDRKHGLVLVVGATGAGKSTTACAGLRTIDTSEKSIVTIEDPIEYRIAEVDQIEVNSRANQTFEAALRTVLRLDADIIFIGEIRDEESARVACRASMTGQLVLATLHANSAVAGALRMGELGVDLQNVAGSLRSVLSQTLVRTLCTECRVPYRLDSRMLQELEARGLHRLDCELYRCPVGGEPVCSNCNGRGFFRRTGVFEYLTITPAIRELMQEHPRASAVLSLARENGMLTLVDEGLRLVREGKVALEEFNRVFDF